MARSRSTTLTYALARAHRLLNGRLDELLQGSELSVEQWRVLDKLSDREGCAMAKLAGSVLMNHPALTKLIDRMVADGLVHRAPDDNDQRRVLVYLTDRGMALFRRVRLKVDEHESELRRELGTQNVRSLESRLKDVLAALDEQTAAAGQ